MTSTNLDPALQLVCCSAHPTELRDDPLRLDSTDAEALFERTQSERIVPLLAHAVNEGLLILPDPVLERVLDRATTIMSAAVTMEATAIGLIAELERAGVSVRVMKGLATAHLDYANPALRQFGDIDVLVPPAQVEDALECLRSSGVKQKRGLLGDDWRLTHSIELDADGFELDLHHRLLHQAAGHLAADIDLFSKSEAFEVAGHTLRALPRPIRLLLAVSQNVLSEPGARKMSSDVDGLLLSDAMPEAARIADSARLGWLLELGCARLHLLDPGVSTPPPTASHGLRDAAFRQLYASDKRPPMRLALAEALVAPIRLTGLTAKSIVLPGEAYLMRRGRSGPEQIRHQLGRLRPWGGRTSS